MSGAEVGIGIALVMLKAIRELNIAYFSLLKSANLSEEDRAILRNEFHNVMLDHIPFVFILSSCNHSVSPTPSTSSGCESLPELVEGN